jgi:NAD/NADP transhydrogenase alpha subunit
MSGANAISGITLIGAVLITGSLPLLLPESTADWVVGILGFLAIVFATVNVVGGFMVTDRMLEMFKKKK